MKMKLFSKIENISSLYFYFNIKLLDLIALIFLFFIFSHSILVLLNFEYFNMYICIKYLVIILYHFCCCKLCCFCELLLLFVQNESIYF